MGNTLNLADIRINYLRGQLRRADLRADPIEQFNRWMEEATASGVVEPTAMSLATAGRDGVPRVRTVLLKGLTEAGFVFYSNFESRKGRSLEENPLASLLFPWLAMERQVLATGRVERVGHDEAARYFNSRPRESRLAAWTSGQSQPVATREALEADLERVRERFGAEEGEVPLPPFWGGYRVNPLTIEFWQGRANRLHDRFEYTRASETGGWKLERLSP